MGKKEATKMLSPTVSEHKTEEKELYGRERQKANKKRNKRFGIHRGLKSTSDLLFQRHNYIYRHVQYA